MPRQLAQSKSEKKGYLRKRSDFLKTYKGISIKRPLLILYARPNEAQLHRLGVTIPKTVGKAVVRNKVKRWCREIFRKAPLGEMNGQTFDINIFVGIKGAKKEEYRNVRFQNFERELLSAIQSLIKKF